MLMMHLFADIMDSIKSGFNVVVFYDTFLNN